MEFALAAFFLFLGAVVASFITVVSERAFTGQSWSRGRSRCNSCRHELGSRDLIPLVSWLLGKGRCRYCGSRLPVLYLIVEGTTALLFLLAYTILGLGLPLLMLLAALVLLAFIVLYDLRHTVVPPLASFLLFLSTLGYALLTYESIRALGFTILMAGFVSLFLFLVHALSRGRAMGLGDAPIAFALALLVGGELAFAGILFSFWIGAVVGTLILLSRRGGPTMGIEVPFVPFLAAGFLLAYFTQWNPFPLFIL